MIKKNILLFFVCILLLACEKDPPAPPPYVDPFEELNPDEYGIDLTHRLLVYNGNEIGITNGTVTFGTDVFQIETADEKLEIGKAYTATYNGEVLTLFRTELPVISIHTGQLPIVDDPKVGGQIRLLETNESVFSSFIGIELRGGVSQTYPKKSFSVELWQDEAGVDKKKVSLLGMRVDDDWILDGLWNEPIRIRDYTAHKLWLEMGRVQHVKSKTVTGIDRKYSELFLNGKYAGLYYLGEKIDRKQLDLSATGELYKAYTWADGVTYDALEPFDNTLETWSGYEVKYPDEAGILDWSRLHEHIDFIVNSSTAAFNLEIASRIDMDNSVDYFLFLNVMYGADNRGKNVYTGKIDQTASYFFLPWDMDGTFGNNWRGDRTDVTSHILSNGLYDRLLEYPDFINLLKERWTVLRAGTFEEGYLKQVFRNHYSFLQRNAVYEREEIVPEIARNYSDIETNFIESWIDRRMIFLDGYIEEL